MIKMLLFLFLNGAQTDNCFALLVLCCEQLHIYNASPFSFHFRVLTSTLLQDIYLFRQRVLSFFITLITAALEVFCNALWEEKANL